MERITSKSLASTIWRKTAQRKPIHVSNPRNAPSLCRERYACPSSRALSDAISPSSPLVERRFLSTDVTEGKARECTGGLRRRAPKNERIHLSTSTPSSSYSSFLSFQSLHPYYRSLSIHLTPVESVRRHQPSHERFSQRKSFSTSSSSFDIFQKLKDPPEDKDDSGNAASLKKRKPSDRVIRLVDEVLNLSLIEAADLCDLCQEKLAERSGGPSFNASAAVGRVPFPHPASMFQGMTMPGLMPPPIMGGGSFPHGSPPPPPPAGASPASAASSSSSDTSETGAKKGEKKEEKKSIVSIKLVGFDASKKVAVVKEVRAITSLGLKESKDLVEQSPKILKKAVPVAEAETLKKKLEAAGAQVVLE